MVTIIAVLFVILCILFIICIEKFRNINDYQSLINYCKENDIKYKDFILVDKNTYDITTLDGEENTTIEIEK